MKIKIDFSQCVYRSVVVEADSLQDAQAKWFDGDEEEEWFQEAIDGSAEYDYEVGPPRRFCERDTERRSHRRTPSAPRLEMGPVRG